ncbi:MAG: DUF1330 domain-containing protein [Pseudomonadota bacterium]
MKGYWIARVTVKDPDRYPDYIAAARPAFERFGARFLVRGGRAEAVEGPGRERNVVIEFPSFEDALACYRSDDYQRAVKIRQAVADGELIIVEGPAQG